MRYHIFLGVGCVETVHKCGDLECIVEKFLSMEQAVLRTSEYALVVDVRSDRAYCTHVSLARREGIEEYEPSYVCDPLATIAIYGRDGDSELLVLDGSCVDMLPSIVPRFTQLVIEKLGTPFSIEFFRLDDNPFVYVKIGSDVYQSYRVVLKKTPLGVAVLYPLPDSRVYVLGMASPYVLPYELVNAVEGLKPIREDASRLRDEIERELPPCTDPVLRIRTEQLLSLFYTAESVYMDMMTGYRVYHAPVIDGLLGKLGLVGLFEIGEILGMLQEEYKRFNMEATQLLEELKKCRD
jgi:hypothetical protein